MITYEKNRTLAVDDIVRVLKASGIKRPTEDVDRIGKMFSNANLICSAWDQGTLIGVARALTDDAYCCYLSDLAVDKAYQKQGVGKRLIETVRAALNPQVSLVLLAAPEAMTYYPKLGFEKLGNAFRIQRTV